jgi:trigger factor
VENMKVTVEDISPVKKKLHIQVQPDAIAKEMEKAVADVAKKAKIPGFRPGKAPKTVVERHYQAEIESEVMNRLISESYLQAVRENNLSPVEMPNITNISPLQKNEPLNFTAQVEVRPRFTLGTYEGIEVPEAPVTVTDEEVVQTIDRLREMYAQLEVVEGAPLDASHTAIIDFEGFREGKPIEGAKAQDHMLALGTGSLIPGFEEQLTGMNKGETREIDVNFPADYTSRDLAGKDAKFTVTLKEIKKKALPELNDEFAKDIGDHKNVDELKARIREDLEIRKKNEQASAQREELMKKLVEAHDFDVPEGMVERELMGMARSQATRMARQGMDLQTFDIAAFRERNKDLAVKRVKGLLLMEAIAEREKIEVSPDEMNAAMAAAARSTGQKLEAVRKYYEDQEGGMDNLRMSLLQEKTLAHLLSKAKKV